MPQTNFLLGILQTQPISLLLWHLFLCVLLRARVCECVTIVRNKGLQLFLLLIHCSIFVCKLFFQYGKYTLRWPQVGWLNAKWWESWSIFLYCRAHYWRNINLTVNEVYRTCSTEPTVQFGWVTVKSFAVVYFSAECL